MKNKHKLWYIGYIVSAILVLIILFTDFPKTADIGLLILMSIIFSISHTQLMHNRMMKNDIDYKVNVMDERNISIKEKSGNITNIGKVPAKDLFFCLQILLFSREHAQYRHSEIS